ncbi:DUF4297 domain-containing protein [Myroides ceti]|uniref:DUF4297 domain-containing protein n=1 Tax=Paenimyroides ceti TaxID=395087 RepID=A0ABT8CR94_9FLAO|nr:DUF4297 domain-containing protein [Paenimyroides ceti]MDN3707023.1 DUF4297 domain-containing protein [Paenimyroides ceti]
MSSTNPLFEAQREKAGSQTKGKYDYQYHWALFKVLSEHQSREEYAVFVELHEDVVISDSLEPDKATFEFNQVKTTSKNMSHSELTRKKNKVKGTSVLAKLVNSTNSKKYSSKINHLNLISIFPFTLELKEKSLELEKITLDDLSDSQVKKLEDAIKDELGDKVSLPKNLQFVVSNLSAKNYQNDVIASISTLIEKMFPESYCKPNDIYRLLYDEINTKGIVTYDFSNWEELLDKKALTSNTINTVINRFTNIKDEGKIQSQFEEIAKEIDLTIISRKKLSHHFKRYRMDKIGNKSVLQLEITQNIVKLINAELNTGEESFKNLIDNVSKSLDDKYKGTFTDDFHLKAAIICEYIYDNE